MPSKKGARRSMPARINQVNTTTLTPSRRSPRSPRVAANSKTSSESTTPSIKPSPTPPESSINFRFYQPKTPPKSSLPHSRSRNASPDLPLNRRRTFQARPSRLSTVFTPAVETPKSRQSSRRTRRTTALETPKQDPSDLDFPELLGSTGWTFDQYLGKFDSNDMGAKNPSTSSSSTEARSSTRLRKPTARAVEASEYKQKPRKAKTPATSGPKGIVKKPKQNSKVKAASKVVLKRIDLSASMAGRKLYDLAAVAMGVDFSLPADLEKIIADAREALEIPKGDAANTTNGAETEPVREPAQDASPLRIIIKFKKKAPPKLDIDGWTDTGRVNDKGEEIVLTPTGSSPYRSPHTYGDEELPYPPVRVRTEQQAEIDNAFGYPPFIGDRNIPLKAQTPFKTEDVTEEKARAQAQAQARAHASGKKRQQEASGNDVSHVPAKKPRRNRRQTEDAAATSSVKSPANGKGTAAESEDIKPPVQRLKLKLKPAPEAAVERPPTNESASQSHAQSGNALESVRGAGRGTGRGNARGSARGGDRGRGRGGVRFVTHSVGRGGSSSLSRGGSSQPATRGRNRGLERGGSSSSSRGSSSQGTTRGDARAVERERGGSSSSSRGASRGTTRGGERGGRGGNRGAGRGGSSSSSHGASTQGSTPGRAGSAGITKNRQRGRGRGKSAK